MGQKSHDYIVICKYDVELPTSRAQLLPNSDIK